MSTQKNKYIKIGYFTVFLGALFYFYEYFLRVSPSAMQHQMMSDFKIDATLFGTLSAFYFYAYTPMQFVVGLLVDRFKLRFVLVSAVLCCVCGTLIFAKAPNYELADFGRFLQGFGSAFAYVGALKLACMWLPAKRFGFFAGLCTSLGFWGAAFGEVILTELMKVMTWRTALEIFTLTGLVLAALFYLCLTKKVRAAAPRHANLKRLSLKEYWMQFYLIIKQPRIWIAGLLSALIFLPTTVFAGLWGIPYLEKLHGYTPGQAAIASSMIFVGWAIGAPVQGYISDYFGTRLRVIMVGALVAFGLSIWVLYSPSLPFIALCVLFVVFGFFSSAQCLTFAIARDLANHRVVGMAIAFVNALTMLSGTIFQSLVGKFLDMQWGGKLDAHGNRLYSLLAYEHAVVIVPGTLIIAAVIALLFRTKKKVH